MDKDGEWDLEGIGVRASGEEEACERRLGEGVLGVSGGFFRFHNRSGVNGTQSGRVLLQHVDQKVRAHHCPHTKLSFLSM